MSPALAAVTLIAFANGAPDVMASYAAGSIVGGAQLAIGSLYGGFMFCTTLVLANVLFNSKDDIKLPSAAIQKELYFYFISIIIVVAFGFWEKTGIIFVIAYFTCYTVYIILSIIMDSGSETTEGENKEKEEDVENS